MKKFTLAFLFVVLIFWMGWSLNHSSHIPDSATEPVTVEKSALSTQLSYQDTNQSLPAMRAAWYRYFDVKDAESQASIPKNSSRQALQFVMLPVSELDEFIQLRLMNGSANAINIRTQDGSLIMIQEAKNVQGVWQPIEYWDYDWGFGSYFEDLILEAGQSVLITAPRPQGNFETDIRFKLKTGQDAANQDVYYSAPFRGKIYQSQFQPAADQAEDESISYLESK
ncbi:MAG: hypothetical protein HC880_18165 [Bacteroidia bacterium]|nr:hypothetical protein [Bacteroidia bacterium]